MPRPTIAQTLHAAIGAIEPGVAARGRPSIAVALSGGRDSMVLLDALATLRAERPFALAAVHVDHGLSPNARAWAQFCADECARRAVPLTVTRIAIVRSGGESPEAAARAARYAALRGIDADAVLLAHHADDQAETLLLQLLRGSGPHGLAAMPARSRTSGPAFLRPFLVLPASTLAAYARERALGWIEDESNADVRLRRNAVRHAIVPALRATFPGYPATVLRAAAHQAEAAELLDVLAAIDAEAARAPGLPLALDRPAVAALDRTHPARARNLLRWFLRQHGLPAPSRARLAALVAQCVCARPDARVRVAHAGATIGVHDDTIVVHRTPAPAPFDVSWRGEATLPLPGGVLHAHPSVGVGIAASALAAAPFVVRPRRGGERVRVAFDRPHQALSGLFQAARTPWWQRDGWPLLWQGERLAAVPGIAVAAPFAASRAMPGYELRWQPDG